MRRSIRQCFSQFHDLSKDIGDNPCSSNIEFITALWKGDNGISTGDAEEKSDEFRADDTNNIIQDCLVETCSKQFEENISSVDVTLNPDLKTVALETLKRQLSDIIQEKLWLENAILARIEYLTNR